MRPPTFWRRVVGPISIRRKAERSKMKHKIPDGTAAVILNTGSVFTPIWEHPEREGYWMGKKLQGVGEQKPGGIYQFPPSQVERCLTAGEFEIWQMCQRHGLEMPPAKR